MTGEPEPGTVEFDLAAEKANSEALASKVNDLETKLAEAEASLVELKAASGDVTRYAVFDTRYDKFVGDVTDKKPSSSAAKKLLGHDDFEIREV